MSKTSLALHNLRGFVILNVLAFHSFIAYIVSQPASPLPFDSPPYGWTANPIVDSHRWLGFDLICAFEFLCLMQLMFFLSGLFVWPSLLRKGARTFLNERFLRIGVPFAVGVSVLMPLAYYPVYRVTAVDPSWPAFWSHWTALRRARAGSWPGCRPGAPPIPAGFSSGSSPSWRWPMCPWPPSLPLGNGWNSALSGSSPDPRLNTFCFSSPASAWEPMGSSAACWRRTECWRGAGPCGSPAFRQRSCCGSFPPG